MENGNELNKITAQESQNPDIATDYKEENGACENGKPAQRDTHGRFTQGNRGGPGRPKGKTSKDELPGVLNMMVKSVRSGGQKWVNKMREDNPRQFMSTLSLLARIVPEAGVGANEPKAPNPSDKYQNMSLAEKRKLLYEYMESYCQICSYKQAAVKADKAESENDTE